jgi:hypothetical protein
MTVLLYAKLCKLRQVFGTVGKFIDSDILEESCWAEGLFGRELNLGRSV